MGETDHIIKELIISKKAQFSMIDLYKTLRSWFDLHEYQFYEKEYNEEIKSNKKNIKIVWTGIREIDEYTRFKINITIDLKNYNILEHKNGKYVHGDLNLKFSADIETDYEPRWWEDSPFVKFFRSVVNKYVVASKREKLEKEIKDDCHDIFNRTKTYLNLQKFS